MITGKFLLLKAGTVASFNHSFMKCLLTRIALFSALLFLITNCSSIKKTSKNVLLGSARIAEDEEIYIPQIKSERKNFFPVSSAENKWVDSVYSQLSFDEKVGQLFMVAAYSNKDTVHTNAIEKLVREYYGDKNL